MAAEVLVTVNRELEKELRSVGSVNSVEMKEARKTLARSWRRVLGVGVAVECGEYGAHPAPPASPPEGKAEPLPSRCGLVLSERRAA
jgi:hypothetical protein